MKVRTMPLWSKKIGWFLLFIAVFFLIFFPLFRGSFALQFIERLKLASSSSYTLKDLKDWIRFPGSFDLQPAQEKVEACVSKQSGSSFDPLWNSHIDFYYDCGFEVAAELYKTDPQKAIALCVKNIIFDLDLELWKKTCREVIEKELEYESKQKALYEPLQQASEKYPDIRKEDDRFGLLSEKARFKIVRYVNYYFTDGVDSLLLKILPDYEDKISIIFKQTPVGRVDGPTWYSFTPKDPEFQAAEVARCAGEQDKFLAFHLELISRPTQALDQAYYQSVGKKIGLNLPAFFECFESRRYGLFIDEQVQAYLEKKGRGSGNEIEVYFDGEKKTLPYDLSEEKLKNFIDTLFNPPKPKTEDELQEEAEQKKAEIRDQFLNQTCPESMFDFEEGYQIDIGDYQKPSWSLQCSYDKEMQKIITKTEYPGMPPDYCALDFESELRERTYNMVNGCLYKGHARVFEKKLLSMVLSGEFGEPYRIPHHLFYEEQKDLKSIGEELHEWFRFHHDGKLYIFFFGGAGCGGCIYNGPFLVINEATGTLEKRNADLPYAYDLILSPSRLHAILFHYDTKELYLYDFLTFSKKLFYKIPEGATVMVCGHGCFVPDQVLQWKDEGHIQIQLIKTDENGEALLLKNEKGEILYDQYVFQGEPFILETGF